MLIVKIQVNMEQIDEIHLLNTGHRNKEGEYLYRFRKPDRLNQYEIYHNRSQPWYFLVKKALEVMEKHIGHPPSAKQICDALQPE